MLRAVGVVVDDSGANAWRVEVTPFNGTVKPRTVPCDAVPGRRSRHRWNGPVPSWPSITAQPATRWWNLALMGAQVELADGVLAVTGHGQAGRVDLDLHDVGELAPTITAMACSPRDRPGCAGSVVSGQRDRPTSGHDQRR